MTQNSQQQSVDAALAANAAQVALLVYLERRAQQAASGFLRQTLADEFRRMAAQYVLLFGGLDRPADPDRFRPTIDDFVLGLDDLRGYDPASAIQPFIGEAHGAGVVWAGGGQVDIPASDLAAQIVEDIPGQMSEAIDNAQRFIRATTVTDWSGVVRIAAKSNTAAIGVDRAVATAVATAMNHPVEQVAAARGAQVLWVAEPNACRVCLKLSGTLADPSTGQWFDETATFGKPGSAPEVWPPGQPLKRPPRHPHCRCVTQVWYGDVRDREGDTSFVDLPAALRREAKRSILLGRSLPSESNSARIDATRRLLTLGSGLPKSVEGRARTSVISGRFDPRHRPDAHRR